SRLTFQSHWASLHDGTPVTVKVLRELDERWLRDCELLPEVVGVFEPLGLKRSQLDATVSDFQRLVEHQLNLKYQADAFDRLLEDSRGFDSLTALAVYTQL